VLNPVAAVNSLVAYLYRRLNQAELNLPVNADGTPAVECNANTCALTESGAVLDCPDARCSSPADRITAYVTTRGNTTYVTYTSDGLPLANLMRDVLPFGNQIADLTEPLLTLAVDSAYYDGNPIPRDPSEYRPARLMPSPTEIMSTVAKVPGAIAEGLTAAAESNVAPHTGSTFSTARRSAESSSSVGGQGTKPTRNVVRVSDKAVPRTANIVHGGGAALKPAEASKESATGGSGEVASAARSATGSPHSPSNEDSSNNAAGDAS
jgi:YD repeat-containing protein